MGLEFLERLPVTLELILASAVIAVVVATLCYRVRLSILALPLRCVPFFWFVVIAQSVIAERYGNDIFGSYSGRFTIGDHLLHLAVAAGVLALLQIPIALEALAQRPTAAAPVRAIAERLPEVIGGCLIVEVLFSWPGEGRLVFSTVRAEDAGASLAVIALIALVALALRSLVRFAAPLREGRAD